jgi:DNA-binding CsgD family transcriptional regulator/tetratricopeptide (TPR) repeat protein
LDDALAGAVDGRGAFVLVEGPAGIGKTQLIAAATSGSVVGVTLRARGAELEQDFAWGVVRQLFEALLSDATAAARRRLLRGPATMATAALGDAGAQAGAAPTARHGLYWLAINLAEQGPLTIVVDDAQWADEASLQWLAYLAARVEGQPIAVLAAVRTPDPSADREALGWIRTAPSARIVRPAPLTLKGTAELLAATAGLDSVGDELAAASHEATGGNPFLLRALVDELVDVNAAAGTPSAAAIRALRPAAIARSVLLRLGRLPRRARDVARVLAILGGAATTPRCAELAGLSQTDAAEALATLTRTGMVVDELPPRFTHPILHAVVLEDIPAAERAALHAWAAAVLRASGATRDQVAAQLLNSEPCADPAVAAWLADAARGAQAEGAPDTAMALAERALREPPAPEERPAVLAVLGRAALQARGAAGLPRLREALEATSDPQDHAALALDLARALEGLSRNVEATAVYRDALAGLPSDSPSRADLEAGLAVAAAQHLSTVPLMLEVIGPRLAAGPPDPAAEPLLAATVALAMTAAGGPDGLGLAQAALSSGRLHDANPSIAVGLALAVLVWSDRIDEAVAEWDAIAERAKSAGLPLRFSFAMTFRGEAHLRAGRLLEAEADLRAALAVPGELWVEAVSPVDASALLAATLTQRGRLDEADALLSVLGPASELSDYQGNNQALLARVQLRLAQQRPSDALTDLDELGRRATAWGLVNPAAVPWRSLTALALAGTDRARAVELASEEVELAQGFGAARAIGIALRAAGLVDRGRSAIEALTEAVAVLEGSPAALEHARAMIDLGAALRRDGRRGPAREALAAGLDAAAACGAPPLAERARGELVAAGARPRRDRITGRDALTASELRVARLAVEGRTNREIAEALWVSIRTVETHLSHTFRKLDVTGRGELAAAMERERDS